MICNLIVFFSLVGSGLRVWPTSNYLILNSNSCSLNYLHSLKLCLIIREGYSLTSYWVYSYYRWVVHSHNAELGWWQTFFGSCANIVLISREEGNDKCIFSLCKIRYLKIDKKYLRFKNVKWHQFYFTYFCKITYLPIFNISLIYKYF